MAFTTAEQLAPGSIRVLHCTAVSEIKEATLKMCPIMHPMSEAQAGALVADPFTGLQVVSALFIVVPKSPKRPTSIDTSVLQ
jgi:hypothetical protein